MRRIVWAGAAVLAAVATVVLSLPGAEAQKVANPGAISIAPQNGLIVIKANSFSLAPRVLPECSDGFNNDFLTGTDFVATGTAPTNGADPQCTSADDDSELAPGFQPKIDPVLNGTIDASGNVTIPTTGVVLPKFYVAIPDVTPGNYPYVVTAEVIATTAATGTLNPLTGAASIRLRFRIRLTGSPFGVSLGANCSVGTTAAPIDINVLSTGTTSPPAPNSPISGSPYLTNGFVRLVNNSFSVPGASGCPPLGFDPNGINNAINQNLGLPSAAGNNTAVIDGQTTPVVQRGIVAKITTTPTLLSGEAPFAVDFSAADSTVTKAPASYLWEFPDGTTATGVTASKTFTNPGLNVVKLTVTDGDGDSATVQKSVNVTSTGSTTTTVPTTSTTTTTTTTVPPTTSTTVPTTTTTLPPGSRDTVGVSVTGAVRYDRGAASTAGNVSIVRDANGIVSVRGSLEYPGANGGTARFTVNAQRFWVFQLWTGDVRVSDPGAGVSLQAPIFGSLSVPATNSVRGTSNWFAPGTFPNLIRPYSLTWVVADRS